MNVIGHFTAAERQEIWRLLADRLASGAQLQPPTEPVSVPEVSASSVEVGHRRYEGWARAANADGTLTWTMTYRTHQHGDQVDERTVNYPWHLVTESQLREELGHVSLRLHSLQPADLGVYIITEQSGRPHGIAGYRRPAGVTVAPAAVLCPDSHGRPNHDRSGLKQEGRESASTHINELA